MYLRTYTNKPTYCCPFDIRGPNSLCSVQLQEHAPWSLEVSDCSYHFSHIVLTRNSRRTEMVSPGFLVCTRKASCACHLGNPGSYPPSLPARSRVKHGIPIHRYPQFNSSWSSCFHKSGEPKSWELKGLLWTLLSRCEVLPCSSNNQDSWHCPPLRRNLGKHGNLDTNPAPKKSQAENKYSTPASWECRSTCEASGSSPRIDLLHLLTVQILWSFNIFTFHYIYIVYILHAIIYSFQEGAHVRSHKMCPWFISP